MSTSGSPLVLQVHTTLINVEIVDRRCRTYRTASGRLRPYFTFCFAPEAHLVMSYTLGFDPPDQRSLVTLLHAAIMQSPKKPTEVYRMKSGSLARSHLRSLYNTNSLPWALLCAPYLSSHTLPEQQNVLSGHSMKNYGKPCLAT
jgi:hypothetical protein